MEDVQDGDSKDLEVQGAAQSRPIITALQIIRGE